MHRLLRRALGIGLAAAALTPAAAGAATITPNSTADNYTDDTICSLREAITIANTNSNTIETHCPIASGLGNDTINLGANTYVLDIVAGGGNDDNVNGDLDVLGNDNLTIDGAGAGQTTINTDDVPDWLDRVLHQPSGTGILNVTDLTVTGGNVTGAGGGILSASGNLLLQRSRVTANTATDGGGVFASGASLSIEDSTISGNTASQADPDGGGAASFANVTVVDRSVVRGNVATSGTATPEGGGLHLDSPNVTVRETVVADNDVIDSGVPLDPRGGGIRLVGTTGETAFFRATTISGNETKDSLEVPRGTGGGLSFDAGAGATATFLNSTIAANRSSSGGGINKAFGTVSLIHTTVGANEATTAGTALHVNGNLNIRGSVVDTSGIVGACATASGTITSQGNNVGRDTTCGLTAAGDEQGVDAQLGALQDNTGPDVGAPGFIEPIFTQAPGQTSTVVDHVPAANCDDETPGAPLLTIDQRGLGRPFEGDGIGAPDCDAGSVELQTTAPPPPPPSGGGLTPVVPATPAAPAAPAPPKKCKKAQKLKKGKCVKKRRKK